jgi:hypothetical protein
LAYMGRKGRAAAFELPCSIGHRMLVANGSEVLGPAPGVLVPRAPPAGRQPGCGSLELGHPPAEPHPTAEGVEREAEASDEQKRNIGVHRHAFLIGGNRLELYACPPFALLPERRRC